MPLYRIIEKHDLLRVDYVLKPDKLEESLNDTQGVSLVPLLKAVNTALYLVTDDGVNIPYSPRAEKVISNKHTSRFLNILLGTWNLKAVWRVASLTK